MRDFETSKTTYIYAFHVFSSVHPIFFDDNIEENDPSIVDARDVRTKEELPFETTKDTYLVQVHPVEAILDPNYFVKKVKQCETRRRKNM